MSILSKKLRDKPPIPGFKVMEWLRGVRDADHELSIRDPKAYQKRKEEARERLIEKARKAGKRVISPS